MANSFKSLLSDSTSLLTSAKFAQFALKLFALKLCMAPPSAEGGHEQSAVSLKGTSQGGCSQNSQSLGEVKVYAITDVK